MNGEDDDGKNYPSRKVRGLSMEEEMSSIASNGYVLVYVGKDHHLSDVRGYAYEHRIVAEKKLGRRLLPGEIVHHLDGDKTHNSKDNIEVTKSIADHKVRHRTSGKGRRLPGEDNPMILCACGCGGSFPKYDDYKRARKYLGGHWRKGRKGGWKHAA
jgi:hypothetical protein